MIVNRLQMVRLPHSSHPQDLQSNNYLEVATALIATSQLLTKDMIPALIHLVHQALNHQESTSFLPSTQTRRPLQSHHGAAAFPPVGRGERGRHERRPATSLGVLRRDGRLLLHLRPPRLRDRSDACPLSPQAEPSQFKDLVPFFSDMLLRIVNGQFDPNYDFDTLPAPWMQMKIIRVGERRRCDVDPVGARRERPVGVRGDVRRHSQRDASCRPRVPASPVVRHLRGLREGDHPHLPERGLAGRGRLHHRPHGEQSRQQSEVPRSDVHGGDDPGRRVAWERRRTTRSTSCVCR